LSSLLGEAGGITILRD